MKSVLTISVFYLNGFLIYKSFSKLGDFTETIAKSNSVVFDPRLIRNAFESNPFPSVVVPPNHTHPKSAAERNSISLFANQLGIETGLKPYFLQMSRADQKAGYDGKFRYYWAKDTLVNPRDDPVLPKHFFVAVDDDYHMNMPAVLLAGKPTLVYTIAPESCAGETLDGRFRFVDNEIDMRVDGGAHFKHALWDYNGDVLTTIGFDFDTINFSEAICRLFLLQGYVSFIKTVVYSVERRNVSEHRQVILLTPISITRGYSAVHAALLATRFLNRLKPLVGDYHVIRSMASDARISIARNGSWNAATVSLKTFDMLREISTRSSKVKLQAASIMSHLPDGPEKAAASQTLATYFQETTYNQNGAYVYPVCQGVSRFQFNSKTYEPDVQPGVVPFMSCLIGPSPAPDMCYANDVQTVHGRITSIAVPDMRITRFIASCINDFVEEYVPDSMAYTLFPVDYEDVFVKQARPSQVTILNVADTVGEAYRRFVASFQKKESYQKVTDPRNISTIVGKDKAGYSRFMYVFTESVLKQIVWYAFGKWNDEIAQRIADICVTSNTLFLGDLSRMDGRENNIMRLLMKAMMLRAFHPSVHEELVKFCDSQTFLAAVTRFGVWYNTLQSRASGSPETAPWNTPQNGFISYVAKRGEMDSEGRFLKHRDAITALNEKGMYAGDDSCQGDLSKEAYVSAARMLGHVADGEVLERGSRGVNFLARVYSPDVWNGRTDTMCDIKRTLWKFHVCANLPKHVSPLSKLKEKALSAIVNDANTPLLGEFVTKSVEMIYLNPSEGDTAWNATADHPYPNENDGWMDHEFELALPDYDLNAFRTWLSEVREPDQLLSPPLCVVEPTPVPVSSDLPSVVVDGEVYNENQENLLVDQPISLSCHDDGFLDLLVFLVDNGNFANYGLPLAQFMGMVSRSRGSRA
jgi:hypothetical protein